MYIHVFPHPLDNPHDCNYVCGLSMYMNMCVCMLMFPSPYMCMHAGPSVSSASPSHPRTSIHPHLVSERELSVLMTKAHLIIRSIQLKIGHDLLMQVISYYVLLYTSTLLYMHTCTVHVHENIREAQLPRLQTASRPIQTLTSHSMRSRTCFCAGATRNVGTTLSALLCQLSHLQLSDLLLCCSRSECDCVCYYCCSSSFPATQVFHKQLTLASTASQASDFSHWHNLIISTSGVSIFHLAVIMQPVNKRNSNLLMAT